MKKNLIVIFVLFGVIQNARGCDACGCQLSSLSMSMLPEHYRHLVGIRYGQASFNARMDHDSQYFSDEYSNDTYRTAEVLARFSLGKRVKVNVSLPYLINNMDGSHQKVQSNGIGDPKLLGYYSVFNNKDSINSKLKHNLFVGGGVELPFGEYQKEDNGVIINRNFQLGSGSVDYLLTGIYSVSIMNWGVTAEAAYKINTTNNLNYRFGNQFNSSLYLFRFFGVKASSIMPYAGLFFETAQRHKDGEVVQSTTGGSLLLGTLGTRMSRGAVSLNLEYQNPLAQKFNSDGVAKISAESRFSVALIFNLIGNMSKKDLAPKMLDY